LSVSTFTAVKITNISQTQQQTKLQALQIKDFCSGGFKTGGQSF